MIIIEFWLLKNITYRFTGAQAVLDIALENITYRFTGAQAVLDIALENDSVRFSKSKQYRL